MAQTLYINLEKRIQNSVVFINELSLFRFQIKGVKIGILKELWKCIGQR